MTKRVLKIEPWDDNPPVLGGRAFYRGSQIRLKGHWLKEAGFHHGATVEVESEHAGLIVLRLNSPVAITAADDDFHRVAAALDAACALVDRQHEEAALAAEAEREQGNYRSIL